MNGRKYEELEFWEKTFYDLNKKLGNDIWGARIEGDGTRNERMRVFINKEEFREAVLKETNGYLAGYPLVFTVLNQDDYARSMALKEKELEKDVQEEGLPETESTST